MSKSEKKGKFPKGIFGPKAQQTQSHGTRATLLEDELRSEKEKFSSMPIDRKRKLYKCDDDYLTLEQIPRWPDYERSSRKTSVLPKKNSKATDKAKPYRTPKYAVNEKLNKQISVLRGDITAVEIDAIVNAANSSLMGGGGVDGAIHSAAGSYLKKECSTLNGCDTGDAKITFGYKLPARYVIHTVGPIGEKPDLLSSAYRRCLEVLKENKLTSVAFPCISTGIYGYPVESACHMALDTIRQWLEKDDYSDKVERIILCVFLKKDVEVYEELLPLYFPLFDNTNDNRTGGEKAEEDSAADKASDKPREVRKDVLDNTGTATPTKVHAADNRLTRQRAEQMVRVREEKVSPHKALHQVGAVRTEEPMDNEGTEPGQKEKDNKGGDKGEEKESEKEGKEAEGGDPEVEDAPPIKRQTPTK